MMKPRPLFALAVVALVAASCGGGGNSADTTTSQTPTTTSTTSTTVKATTTSSSSTSSSTSTTVPVVPRQPLTGEPLESTADIIDRAALVAKIDNVKARQNHTGLAVADIVFEEVVEGDATRFAAVFHSQSADPLGPIRSGREQDVDMFTSFNQPLFVWSGGNPGVTRLINESPLINMSPFAKPHVNGYYRGPGSAPHNEYTSTDIIWSQTPPDQPGPPGQQFDYLAEGDTFTGDPTAGVHLNVGFRRIDWDWNPDIAKFERSQDGTKHIDKTYGQIAATNVILMGVQYKPSTIDAHSPDAQTTGEGPIYVLSDGKIIQGTWKRDSPFFSLQFFDNDGNPISLNPGNTWVELPERIATDDPSVFGIGVDIKPAS